MFEEMTFEAILEEMLSMVTSDVDKREGSIIYDALAPAALKLAEYYFYLENFIDLVSGDTAVGEYLDRVVNDYGLTRKMATKAIRKIITSVEVDIGTRWGVNETVYTITEMLQPKVYMAECEQPGVIGNAYTGLLENIDNVSGVTATLTDVIEAGIDEQTDDELRERFREYATNPTQDGNNAQYKKWAVEYPGVAAAKVFPLWNGGNTVKITITDALFTPAESTLVNNFQSFIDPGAEGKGNGRAPIGSKVTITGGLQKDINVAANVILAEGYADPTGASEIISSYLKTIVFEKNSVSYMRIGGALLDCPSIVDINSLKVNSGTVDVSLTGEEIPVLVGLNLTVVSG